MKKRCFKKGDSLMVTEHDRAILRNLATKQLDYANSDRNVETIKEWKRHRQFKFGRPMVHIELGTFAPEVLNPLMKCETELGRQIEESLYRNFITYEQFGDDQPVVDYYPIKWKTYFELFDLKVNKVYVKTENGPSVGHHFEPIIHNLKEDYELLKPSTYGVDREGTLKYQEAVEDIIGDILPTKIIGSSLVAVPTQKIIHIMSMETIFMSMIDYPELFQQMMERIADDYIAYFKWLEKEKLILPTTSTEHLNQGSWCFTDELPNEGELTAKDVWGFMDSQESVGISPDMFNTFIFPCYEKISKLFGLLSYGCCEPVNVFWEKSLKRLDNLRNVSISAWCDEEFMANELRGKKIIYHRKPVANFLSTDKVLNEEALRAHIRHTLLTAQGCQLEIAQRDIGTIHHNVNKPKRYIEIVREEINNNWK